MLNRLVDNGSYEMKEEIRKYLRSLSKDEIIAINKTYKKRIEARRNGFLTRDQVEQLLRIKKQNRGTHEGDLSKYFSEIREKSNSALLDFKIVCDTLSENELEKIFTKTYEFQLPNQKYLMTEYPITRLLSSLLPYESRIESKSKESVEDGEWRKLFLEDFIINGLLWYFYSGLFKTDAEKQMLFDVIDAINVKSSGVKKYTLLKSNDKIDVVEF